MALLQSLLFICLLPLLSSELAGISAIHFQYTANGSRERFTLLEPTDPSYNGTKPAYGADGAVWLTPNPETAQELATYIETKNVGRFIFNQPVQFAHGADNTFASFSTSFEFQIVCVPDAYGHCADGMAFFIASQAAIPANATGGFLGLTDNSSTSPHFFAVEFDTFQNVGLEDPSFSHIGIDFNSLISSVTTNTAASKSPLYLYNNSTFLAWVEYNASSHHIQVWMTSDTTSKERPPQPILETHYDLSTIFNDYMLYVGFSASTGRSYEGHALYAWSFSTQALASPTPSTPTHSKNSTG